MSRPDDSPEGAALLKASIVPAMTGRTLEDSLDELVPRALHGAGPIVREVEAVARSLKEKLKLKPPLIQAGVAFVHAHVKGLASCKAALGVSPCGLEPPPGQDRVYVVFLSLTPEKHQGSGIPAWAKRKLGDEKTLYELRKVQSIEAALGVLGGAP
ncbi:MAG: hypothetical protein HY924_02850 [Elusimicrobia bacterium]|nr:hypothetical protein [Elusimicrobiota bacterium]